MYIMGFPGCHSGRDGNFDPGSARSPGERNGYLPAPVFLPGKFHGQRSLAGDSPSGHKKLDMTEDT